MNIYKYCRQILFAREKIFVRRVSPRIASRLLFLLMCNLRVVRCRIVQVQCELFCGESPLTLRPNFKCEKGSVTAAAAACSPRRGIFVGENLLYNLRVMRCHVVQGKRELFSFFASFFLFSKEKKKRNSL